PPRRPAPLSTLFPYTTLFRSEPLRPTVGANQKLPGAADRGEGGRAMGPIDAGPVFLPFDITGLGVEGQQAGRFLALGLIAQEQQDRKSTRLNSSHLVISYAVF